MKIKITYELDSEPILDTEEYWGLSDSVWNELEEKDKHSLIEGWIRLHISSRYVELVDTESK